MSELSTLSALSTVTLLAVGLGWVAGRRFERAARGWRDYRKLKADLPVLRALARALSLRAAGAVALAIAVTGLALHTLTSEAP
ncbi:MAG: hypothetical protein ACRDT1_02655 [Micromonosporaceae bacterium]